MTGFIQVLKSHVFYSRRSFWILVSEYCVRDRKSNLDQKLMNSNVWGYPHYGIF